MQNTTIFLKRNTTLLYFLFILNASFIMNGPIVFKLIGHFLIESIVIKVFASVILSDTSFTASDKAWQVSPVLANSFSNFSSNNL